MMFESCVAAKRIPTERMSDSLGNSAGSGQNIRFEETLSLNDEEGAKGLIRFTRIFVVFLIVVTLIFGFFVLRSMANVVGGVDVALQIVNSIRSERPLVFAGLGLFVVLVVSYGVFSVVGFAFQMRQAFDKEVHTRVTDTEVSVQRKGSGFWQSSELEIPFNAITSVEYLHPDKSSTRIEFGDARSKQFFAGRSKDWVRIERSDDQTVYIGSDRPRELAEMIAQGAPNVANAKQF